MKKLIIIAAALANARGMRRGVPTIANVLDLLPEDILAEVMDDAQGVLEALREVDAAIVLRQTDPA